MAIITALHFYIPLLLLFVLALSGSAFNLSLSRFGGIVMLKLFPFKISGALFTVMFALSPVTIVQPFSARVRPNNIDFLFIVVIFSINLDHDF